MARIRIEDLSTDHERLAPEALGRILGAGRPSFRLGVENLENREVPAANFTNALSPAILPAATAVSKHALIRTLTFGDDTADRFRVKRSLTGDVGAIPIQAQRSAG